MGSGDENSNTSNERGSRESWLTGIISEEQYHEALFKYQTLNGLNATGELDNDTASYMARPRQVLNVFSLSKWQFPVKAIQLRLMVNGSYAEHISPILLSKSPYTALILSGPDIAYNKMVRCLIPTYFVYPLRIYISSDCESIWSNLDFKSQRNRELDLANSCYLHNFNINI